MTVDTVCERLKQIEGLEPSMLPQYCATIRKVRPLPARGEDVGGTDLGTTAAHAASARCPQCLVPQGLGGGRQELRGRVTFNGRSRAKGSPLAAQ